MTSITVSMTGNSPSLTTYFHPEIVLNDGFNYSCCLLDFSSSDSLIVDKTNNKLHYQLVLKFRLDQYGIIEVPAGVYGFEDIARYVEKEMEAIGHKLTMKVDTATMKTSIDVPRDICIDFTRPNSVGNLLGFNGRICGGGEHVSERHIPNIHDLTTIRINCDLITGSFHNGIPTHTIHEFSPQVDAEYKIIEQPKNLIYLPVVRRRINSISISTVDRSGRLIDLHGKQISCRIHIKRC